MENTLFNNSITKNSFLGYSPKISKNDENEIIASLFEQLLLFDKIVLSTNKDNYTLFFLISRLGLKTVERLIRSGYIKFSIKSAVLITSMGRQRKDGSIDESVIYKQPPISGGSLQGDDIDPSVNVYRALQPFRINKTERKRLIKLITPNYVKNDGLELGGNTAKIVVDAYLNNNLEQLGLPFKKPLFDLDLKERDILMKLGYKVLDSSILTKNNYKSYNNYDHLKIYKKNLDNIGKAYNISENVSTILRIENTPKLKELFIDNNLKIDDIFKLRHLSSAKYFRQWVNQVGENSNSFEVTEAYLKEITGENKFINTKVGGFVKTIFLFGASAGLATLATGTLPLAAAATPVIKTGIDFSIGLLEQYVLDDIIKGENPRTYISELKDVISKT